MRDSLRKSGINAIGDVPWGTHICQFYRTKEDLLDTLIPYFKAGLKNNEFCLWVISEPLEIEEAEEDLRKAISDLNTYFEKGQIEIIPYTDWFTTEGIFDSERVSKTRVEKLNHALDSGYDGMRLSGNTSWLEKESWDSFIEFKEQTDKSMGDYQLINLCTYPLDKHNAAEIIDVVVNHQFALIKREGKWKRMESAKRKQAEQAALRATKNWEQTIDVLPDPIAVLDTEYKIVRMNKAMATRLRTSPEECVGVACYRVVHGTDEPPSFCPYTQLLKDGIEHTAEFCENYLNGYFKVSVSPLYDPEEKLIGSILVAHDITDIKEAEAKLKEARDNLENLVKERTTELEQAYMSLKESEKGLAEAQRMAHIGNWKWNLLTDEKYWSDEVYRIFGLKPQEFEVAYDTFLSYVHPDDRDYVDNATKEALKRKTYKIDFRIILADGEERIVHEEGEVVFDEKNTPVQMLGTIQDITERKEAEKALRNIGIARKKEIHHRIKNNLQVISSLLDLQAENFKNREHIKDSEVIDAFRESQDRVMSIALIHEELHEGKGTNTLNFPPYLERLVENLFQTYTLGNIDIDLNLDFEENIFFDMDTAVPLGLIVNELVSNSLKYAFPDREKGKIQIKLCREESTKNMSDELESKNETFSDSSFVLTVLDHGIGLPENINLENPDTLGIQLVVALVDQLDGELKLVRKKGTKFTIKFMVQKK
jgi:PAS domain S-box-containing protein